MFGFHPHSVFCYGLQLNINNQLFTNEKLTNSTPLLSRFVLYVPFVSLHFKFCGYQPVNAENLGRLMHAGKTISLSPGGF